MLPQPFSMILSSKIVQYQSVAHRYIVCVPERGIFPVSGDTVEIQIPSFARVMGGSIEVDTAFDSMSTLDVGLKNDLQKYAKGVELNKTHSVPLQNLPQKFVNSTDIIITFNNGHPYIGEATIRVVYEVDGRVHATR